jgi:hypothetical protein
MALPVRLYNWLAVATGIDQRRQGAVRSDLPCISAL